MLRTPTDAIKIPGNIVRKLSEIGVAGHMNWVTPRLLAELACKPFRLMRRGWKLTSEPFGYTVGTKTFGQFLHIDRAGGRAVLETRTQDAWFRIAVSLKGELLAAGPTYSDGSAA